jgi:myo-inositol 2-dehydrogenase/D-chiro-inositol 1-dehydrogenase
MGALHACNAAASGALDLAWIADQHAPSAERLARAVDARVGSFEAIRADPARRGVVVVSSTAAPLDHVRAALAAGKAVFCEKPLDLSLERLDAAAELFARADLPPLFVAFNRRFDPHYRALADRIAAGEIGRLETLHIVNHDPEPPSLDFIPASGGLFKDFTIHDFDLAAWLLDEPIAEVFAWASCLVDPRIAKLGDTDTAKTILRTVSGRLCTISNSRRTGYGYDQRIEAFGSDGALRVDNVPRTAVHRLGEAGVRADRIPYAFPQRYAAAYRGELEHFAEVLAGTAAPRTGYAESRAALALAEAAARSAREGRPVRLTGDGDTAC